MQCPISGFTPEKKDSRRKNISGIIRIDFGQRYTAAAFYLPGRYVDEVQGCKNVLPLLCISGINLQIGCKRAIFAIPTWDRETEAEPIVDKLQEFAGRKYVADK